MSADPDSISLAAKLIMGVSAIGSAIVAPVIWVNKKLDTKADKEAVENYVKRIDEEFSTHRTYFAKVFDQMRQNEQRAQDRHERLMERIDK